MLKTPLSVPSQHFDVQGQMYTSSFKRIYEVDINQAWWIFIIPSIVVIGIALLTVSIHTLKAARSNPAKSLRYE